MSVFSLVTLSIFASLVAARAEAFTIDDMQTYLDQSFEENVSLNRAFVESARHVHELKYWVHLRPENHQFEPQLEIATQNRNALESRLTKQMIGALKLTKAEFIQLFNLISGDCVAGISGDQVIIDQKLPDGSHHLAELPVDSGLIKHTVRADIGPHNVTKFNDPTEFTLIGISNDSRLHPWTHAVTFNVKIVKRQDSNRYQLAAGGMVVRGFSNATSLFWKTEEAIILTCSHKSEIQF